MIMQNTLYSFENVKAENVFFVTKDKVKCVFQPAELPIDEKYKKMLVFWLEHFMVNVPVDSDSETINENKRIYFTITDIAMLLHISIEEAIEIMKKAFSFFLETGLEWKGIHFSLIQDTLLWTKRKDSNKQCEVTLGEAFANLLPKMYSVWIPQK